jgi:hypothetical protein
VSSVGVTYYHTGHQRNSNFQVKNICVTFVRADSTVLAVMARGCGCFGGMMAAGKAWKTYPYLDVVFLFLQAEE